MGKVVFLPVGVGGGLIAGLVGKKLFGLLWGGHRWGRTPEARALRYPAGKLALALVIEGALFSPVKGLVDQAPDTPSPVWPAHGKATRHPNTEVVPGLVEL